MEDQEEFQPIQEKFIQEQQIIQCLTRLGEELENLQVQQPIRILMIGGAYMITQIKNRKTTRDVDVLVHIHRDTDDYIKLLIAASFVSVEMHVSNKWFSDGIGDLMQVIGEVPSGQLWLKHGMLEVYVPEPEYILALKLLAGGRKKDAGDVKALFQLFGISTREQAEELLEKHFIKEALEAHTLEISKSLKAFVRKSRGRRLDS